MHYKIEKLRGFLTNSRELLLQVQVRWSFSQCYLKLQLLCRTPPVEHLGLLACRRWQIGADGAVATEWTKVESDLAGQQLSDYSLSERVKIDTQLWWALQPMLQWIHVSLCQRMFVFKHVLCLSHFQRRLCCDSGLTWSPWPTQNHYTGCIASGHVYTKNKSNLCHN